MDLFGDDLLTSFGNIIALMITILVLFYAFGDGPPFRLAMYLFVGVSAGYVGGVTWHSILKPRLINPLLNPEIASIPVFQLYFTLFLAVLLLTKISPKTAVLGNPVSAFIIGIGAAAAIAGAIQGTLLPLTSPESSVVSLSTVQLALGESVNAGALGGMRFILTLIYLTGTITTLMYFHFSAKTLPNQAPIRNRIIQFIANIGHLFIAVTFGVIFAGAIIGSLDALIERLNFVWTSLSTILFGQ